MSMHYGERLNGLLLGHFSQNLLELDLYPHHFLIRKSLLRSLKRNSFLQFFLVLFSSGEKPFKFSFFSFPVKIFPFSFSSPLISSSFFLFQLQFIFSTLFLYHSLHELQTASSGSFGFFYFFDSLYFYSKNDCFLHLNCFFDYERDPGLSLPKNYWMWYYSSSCFDYFSPARTCFFILKVVAFPHQFFAFSRVKLAFLSSNLIHFSLNFLGLAPAPLRKRYYCEVYWKKSSTWRSSSNWNWNWKDVLWNFCCLFHLSQPLYWN